MSPNDLAPELALQSQFTNCVYGNDGLEQCYGNPLPSEPFYKTPLGLLALAVFLVIIGVIVIAVVRRRHK